MMLIYSRSFEENILNLRLCLVVDYIVHIALRYTEYWHGKTFCIVEIVGFGH